MKKHHILDYDYDYDFVVLAINSHIKAYKLSWVLNKSLGLNLEITDNHKIDGELIFTRYRSETIYGGVFNLLSNRSKNGHMVSSKKSVNFFLSINKDIWRIEKYEILSKLRAINDILLVFELQVII